MTPDPRRLLAQTRSAAGASADGSLAARALTRGAAARRLGTVLEGRRVVWPSQGRARLERFELPRAGAGEVTVELEASSVSPGTERAQYLRLPNARPSFPHHPGYSGAGVVVAAGRGVSGLAPGARVAVPRAVHASLATVPASEVYAVPAGVSAGAAALTYLAIIAANGVERAGFDEGDLICIVGAGTIGLLAQRIAAARGARTVVVARSDRARDLVEATTGSALVTVEGASLEEPAAAVIEATGDPHALGLAARLAGPGARVVLLGSPRGTGDVPLRVLRERELVLVGAHISHLARERAETGRDDFRRFAEEYLGAVGAGTVPADDLVGEAVDPREPERFYRRLAAGDVSAGTFDWTLLDPGERSARASFRRRPRSAPSAASARAAEAVSEPLGFAIVGCGDIGTANAAAVANAANARVVSCVDDLPELARDVAARHDATPCADLDQALTVPGVEAVVISVPHALHEQVALAALDRGLHVVLEKPVAHDLASALRIAAAAEESAGVVSVCLPFRYERAVAEAARFIAEGRLGAFGGSATTVLLDKPPSYWRGGYSGRATSPWRASRAVAGGGILIMNATHFIDWALHLTSASVEEVHAYSAGSAATGDVEDAIVVGLRYAGGAIGSIVGASSARGAGSQGLRLWGEDGQVVLDDDPRAFSVRAGSTGEASQWHPLGGNDEEDPRVVFFDRFASAVREGREPDVPLLDGLAVQTVVEAAYRSAADGRPVALQELAG
jgi:UDP-N-acetyl-2-amino-2-deoxyglucuronate dehydrogenase